MGYGTTRCLILDAPVDPDANFPVPDTGPDDPPDPYLRAEPENGYFALETALEGKPIEIQKRIVSGEVIPNAARISALRWEMPSDGEISATFPTSPWFSAGGPTLYGGVIAWMAETVMGAAVYSTLGPGEVFGTLDMNVRFTRPAPIHSGDLSVTGNVQHRGRRLRIASANVTNSEGKRVAMATSSALVVPGGIKALMRGWIPDQVLQA